VSISPALLIRDLGRPERFLNMLRVFKPTSPMNLGSWILTFEGTAVGLAALLELLHRRSRLQRLAEGAAGALGPALATYTAVLLSDTSVPAWHEARRELPVVFAGSAAASAGAACMLLAPIANAAPARRLVLGGALVDEAALALMERRLGSLAEPYRTGEGGRYSRRARRFTLVGAALTAIAGRRKPTAALAAGLTLTGALCRRFAIYKAGFDSALDPSYTVEPQRRRLDQGASRPG
jgi:formate-dependent nitrite reductase membrane component NrfD